MKVYIFIFCLITFSATPIRDLGFTRKYFIVWNVGQGQWTTAVSAQKCMHFDMGGEFFPLKRLRGLCSDKPNELFLSHWDWDHIGGVARWKIPSCIAAAPLGKSSAHKMEMLAKMTACSDSSTEINSWIPRSLTKNTNDSSRVVMFQNFLLPGDSTIQQEKIWSTQPAFHDARVLVLGHHGSKTSTSETLLQQLPALKLAISSARWKRYHHQIGRAHV